MQGSTSSLTLGLTWKVRRLRVPLVILVGGVWSLAFLDGLLTKSFTALGITTPVVMIVAGAVFAIKNGNS